MEEKKIEWTLIISRISKKHISGHMYVANMYGKWVAFVKMNMTLAVMYLIYFLSPNSISMRVSEGRETVVAVR